MKTKLAKIPTEFDKEITQILGEKMGNGTLKKIPKNSQGNPIILKKMPKSKYWQTMREELINNEFEPEI